MANILNSHSTPFYRSWAQRKYTPGILVSSLDNLIERARAGYWFYTDPHTPKHGSILLNQSAGRMALLVERRTVRIANRAPEFPYVFKAVWHKSRARPAVRSQWWATCSELPGQQIIAFDRRTLLKRCIEAVTNHTGRVGVRVEVILNIDR